MSGVPASSRGPTFNGGTITNPLTIDLTADLADRTALDVIQPSTFGFTVRPFRLRQTDFGYLEMTTSGAISSAGNTVSTAGGSVRTIGGQVGVQTTLGASVHILAADAAGFFGATPTAQHAAIADAAGGVVIDAEARAALNTILATLRAYGLIAT